MNDPLPASEEELAAVSQTIVRPRDTAKALHDRLAAASSLLRSVGAPPTEAALIFSPGGNAPVQAVPVAQGIVVGRGTTATIRLEGTHGLSRVHFGVRPQAGAWLLEDLGSRNGTSVDGVEGRITRRLLRDGDIIFAGDLLFLFVNPVD